MAEAGNKRNEGGARKRKPPRGKKPKKAGKRSGGDTQKDLSVGRAQLIWAIAHPIRRRILRKLADSDAALSPTRLSVELKRSLNVVSYHVRVLHRLGSVEEANAKMVRGALEHFYVSTIENDPPIETLLAETREADEEGSE